MVVSKQSSVHFSLDCYTLHRFVFKTCPLFQFLFLSHTALHLNTIFVMHMVFDFYLWFIDLYLGFCSHFSETESHQCGKMWTAYQIKVCVFFAFILVIWRTHIKYKTRFNICMYFITHKFNKKKTIEIYLNAVDLKTIQPIMKMKCEKKWSYSSIVWIVIGIGKKSDCIHTFYDRLQITFLYSIHRFFIEWKEFYFLNFLIKKIEYLLKFLDANISLKLQNIQITS